MRDSVRDVFLKMNAGNTANRTKEISKEIGTIGKLILTMRKRELGDIMKKDDLENLTLRGHTESQELLTRHNVDAENCYASSM